MEIIKQLMHMKIDKFTEDFKGASRALFYDKKEEKLIHPGEFGTYRERIVVELLKSFLPKEYECGTGFIVNNCNEISTQCDIIIYSNYTPLFSDNENARFFTVETCAAVGEVKSILGKKDFKEALIKLSNIKKIRSHISQPYILKSQFSDYNPLINHSDQILTFLICERLDFGIDEIEEEINQIYHDENISPSNRHNMILSLDDGLFTHYEVIDSENVTIQYPVLAGNTLHSLRVYGEDKYNYIKLFMAHTYNAIIDTTILLPEMTIYMGASDNQKLIFQSKK